MASRFSELRELEKEDERKAREDMRASKKDTERLLGKSWREREAAKRKTPEYQAAKAQEALAERAMENRNRAGSMLPSPLEEGFTRRKIDLPGGGKVDYVANHSGTTTITLLRGRITASSVD